MTDSGPLQPQRYPKMAETLRECQKSQANRIWQKDCNEILQAEEEAVVA